MQRWQKISLCEIISLALILASCELTPSRQDETPTSEKIVVISTFTPTATEYIAPSQTPTPTPLPTTTFTPTITPTPTQVPIGPFILYEEYDEQSLGVIYDLSVSPEGT